MIEIYFRAQCEFDDNILKWQELNFRFICPRLKGLLSPSRNLIVHLFFSVGNFVLFTYKVPYFKFG